MLQASNLGRTLSPVSGVVVAVAGMAKISPVFEVTKTHLGAGACWAGDCYRCYRADGARNGSSGHRQVNSNAGGSFLRLYHVAHCGICVAVCQLCREQFQQ
ncbi:hypothetical protein ACLB1E_29180 [Escherichia coli]